MNDDDAPVDLTNCDREPIHIPGLIQPFGFLVALSTDWLVARTSQNVEQVAGVAIELGRPFADFAEAKALHAIRNRMALLRGSQSVERIFKVELFKGRPPFDVAVYLSGGQIVIEAEPSEIGEEIEAAGTVRAMMARLDQQADDEGFFREGVRQVRALTGFDRVMVYRFAPDGSGEVIAEAAKPGIGSFKGLHYPASDIPAQARELYRRNIFRIIADVEAVPSPIHPVLDENGQPLDLSMSILRAVSPIHIEYLKNMGVGASLSISIIVDDQLWGLFACHHYSARRPSFERRSVAELFGQMFSLRLESRERKHLVDYERRARDIADQLLSAVASDDSLLNDPDWISDILRHSIPADGVGVWINGNYAFSGHAPSTRAFARVVGNLNRAATGRVFSTDNIAAFIGMADYDEPVAGMLAIPISRTPRDYVVLFRAEAVRSVTWAGDPHKPAEYGPNGPRLTPRKSFEAWTEEVRGRSKPFSPSEIRVAETLRATLIEVVLRLSEEASADRQEASARQELLIAELNHRVRNILGVIRGLVRQSTSSDSVDDYVQQVDGRIHALARAHNQITRDHWGPAPLKALLTAEASAFLAERADRVTMEGPDVYLNPQAYATLALVLHELVTNSAKYGSLSSESGDVLVQWSLDAEGSLDFLWQERGGPKVRKPQRIGFGSTIINRSIPYDLGGKSEIQFNPEGVRALLCIPKRHIANQSTSNRPHIDFAPSEPPHASGALKPVITGEKVLLVEDSLIIALDAEDILKRLGAERVDIASNPMDALEFLETLHPTIVMFDINLGDTTSFAVADRARELGIPYIFATGYGEQAKLPAAHVAVAVVQKPYTARNISRALAELVERRDHTGDRKDQPIDAGR